MRLFICLICLFTLWGGALAAPTHFQPSNKAFQITVPQTVRLVESSETRQLWGCDDGKAAFLFGYCEMPGADRYPEESLRKGLNQFVTGFIQSAEVQERTRRDVTIEGLPGVELEGVARYGNHWVRVMIRGTRIFVMSSDGTSQAQNESYWKSFQLGL